MTVDPGQGPPRQPNTAVERTRLAWTRTTLAIVAGAITLTRLLWERSPVVGATMLVGALCAGGALVVVDALRSLGTAHVHDGLGIALVAGGTCALGCAALALVALR